MEAQNEQKPVRKLSAWRAARTVFWSFFGVRRGKDHADDVAHLSSLQIIIAGVVGGVLFVATLLTIVNFVVP